MATTPVGMFVSIYFFVWPFSYTQHQPTVSSLLSRWAEFYQEYQSFEKGSQRLDMDMSNMNPFISDMEAVTSQLEKLKVTNPHSVWRDF